MSVKRYSEQVNEENDWNVVEHPEGEYVLHSDYARLKDEVERLKEGNECLGQMHDKEMERSAYLLEEFNRTTAWGRGLESDLSHARVEISFLKAEVERLTGDYNRLLVHCYALERDIEEGKQP